MVVSGKERAIRQRLAAAPSATNVDRNALANCETTAAAALLTLGRHAEASACCDRAIEIREQLVKTDTKNDRFARDLAESLMRSGSVRAAAGDAAGAAADWRGAVTLAAAHPTNDVYAAILRAFCRGALAGLADKPRSAIARSEAMAFADQAVTILRHVSAGGFRDPDLFRTEPTLDALRRRDDFRMFMMDQSFPAEPFSGRQ